MHDSALLDLEVKDASNILLRLSIELIDGPRWTNT